MKTKNILTSIFIVLIFSSNCIAQTTEYPTHLFLGGFSMATVNDTTVEMWDPVGDDELAGRSVLIYSDGGFLYETLRMFYLNGKLNYCATLMEQNPDNPEGEICFELKSYKDLVFTFENKQHDFPKRIIYDFKNWRFIKARVEDDTSGYNLEYTRDFDIFKSYTLKGVFLKEPFENKGGKIIDGLYDYFFKVQGIKYFIKLGTNAVKKEEIDNILNKEVKASFSIKEGLWDADDNTHQSRIGKYISIINIY
jgi:hypothetical protein